MSNIVTDYSHDFLSIVLNDPIQIGKNKLSCSLTNCDQKFYIQTPRLEYKYNDNDNACFLFKGRNMNHVNEFYQFVLEIEQRVQQKIKPILSKILEQSENELLFRSSIKHPNHLDHPIFMQPIIQSDSFECYSKKGLKLDFNTFKSGREAKSILLCDSITITPTHYELKWTAVQALVYERKIKQKKGFSIQEDTEVKEASPFYITDFQKKKDSQQDEHEIKISLDSSSKN